MSLASVSAEGAGTGVVVPAFKDKYSEYVRKLEAGNTDIDYRDFRDSFVESQQFKVKGEKDSVYSALKKEMFEHADKSNFPGVIKAAKALLSIDYTSMYGHKMLQRTYKILGDAANERKYHDIEFGLLKSILTTGDAQTPETALHVIQIEEEYFIINALGARLKMQSLTNIKGRAYDRMDVTTDSGEKTFYFDVTEMLARTKF